MSEEGQQAPARATQGMCRGHWSAVEAECSRCYSAVDCRELTKGKDEQDKATTTAAPAQEPEKSKLSPLDHMLKALEGTLDHDVKTSEDATAHVFSRDNAMVAIVAVSKSTGRIQLKSAGGAQEFDGIESIEQADGIVKGITG